MSTTLRIRIPKYKSNYKSKVDVIKLNKLIRLNKVKNVYKFEGKCIVNDVIHAECIFSAMIHDIPGSS